MRTDLSSRIYADTLPVDGRQPFFTWGKGLDALLGALHGDPSTELRWAFGALEKPPVYRTNGAKRVYWKQPTGSVMFRLTEGERYALLAMLSGVAPEAIRESHEMEGVRKHLKSVAKKFRRKELV